MRRLLLLSALVAASSAPALAQDHAPPPPIRAWLGPHGAFLTNFKGIGGEASWRFTIERPGGLSGTVLLGTQGTGRGPTENDDDGGFVAFGALLGGRSFALGDGAFANLSAGVGYAQGENNKNCNYVYPNSCPSRDARGVIVPVRLEVHVATSPRVSIGASVVATPISPIGPSVGVGLHANYGRNLRGE